eukprot:evm.model.NODE_51388_length_35829_cov_35.323898.2
MMRRFRRKTSDMEAARTASSSSSTASASTSPVKRRGNETKDLSGGQDLDTLSSSAVPSLSASTASSSTTKAEKRSITSPPREQARVSSTSTTAEAWWWPWKNVLLSLGLALILTFTVKGYNAFDGMEDNGFALVAATAPGSHWGNWRSLTRCDCKAFQQCTNALSKSKTLKDTRLGRFFQLATCKLATGQDEDCQLRDKELKRGLTRFRFFGPELVLRLRLAADFKWWARLGCYFLMCCALLEIIFYLIETTQLRWQRKGAMKQEGSREWWEKEVLVWLFLIGWHEALSYAVHYVYNDQHTMCDGIGLFFRDAMALYTLIQVGMRAVVKRGPNAHRVWLVQAEQKYAALQGKPLWVQVVRDPRIGAFHLFSGLELKVTEDPVGVISGFVKTFLGVAERVLRYAPHEVQKLVAMVPYLGGKLVVGGPGPVPEHVEGSSSKNKDT